MTRTEAIAIITAALPVLDDASIVDLADLVQVASRSEAVSATLTDHERAQIERSKEDFKAGRTYSVAEARAISDSFLDTLRAKYPDAP